MKDLIGMCSFCDELTGGGGSGGDGGGSGVAATSAARLTFVS